MHVEQISNMDQLIKCKLSAEEASYMVREISYEEIKTSMFQTDDNKAPRPALVSVLKESIEEFRGVSGLIPNYNKSIIIFGSLSEEEKYDILEIMPFKVEKLPIRYLGVLLTSKRIRIKECRSLIDKVESRISNWKNKSLSYAVRLIAKVKVLKGDLKLLGRMSAKLKRKESLLVKWINTEKLKGRSIWEIEVDKNDSWVVKKIDIEWRNDDWNDTVKIFARRIFRDERRSIDELYKIFNETVRLRLLSLKVKDTIAVRKAQVEWDVKLCIGKEDVPGKNSGKDKLQIFNLHVKANKLKQSDKSLEDFWIALQEDIRTGDIIGCGTERDGLYYVDEMTTSGTVMLAHGTSEREACATKDTVPNLISKVSNSQPSDSLNEIPKNIHETVGVQEHEEPTLIEVPEKYVLLARSNRGIPPKRYTLEKASKSSKYPIANIARGNLSKEAKAFFVGLYSEDSPSNVKQALKSKKWKNAMDVEMDAMMRNGTWDKCILPQGKKPVGCRWIFTIKYKLDGTVERYKARLVAKGYTQTYGIDYSETFSPVAKIDTIRVLFSIAANQGWPLHQFDVKNALLKGELKEEVYMEAPPGFSQDFKHGEVCKLKKSLYGLKQSPRAWFGRFTLAMKKYGYKQSNSYHTLFLSHRGDRVTCLIIYVDDMIITGNDESEIKKLKEGLCAEFEMKDLGNLRYFLGIEVMRSQHRIFICQKKYILDLLAETRMDDCKPVDTPMITNQKLFMKTKAKLADRDMYQRMVGKLIYMSHTRPDIAYSVGVVSQFMHQPQVDHMHVVLRIVRYLKGTIGHGVLFKTNGHLNIQIFTDANWARDKGNIRSTLGYFSLVRGNLVTWKSKKQKVVSLSSAEAEFRGIAKGLAEALWIRKLVFEIGFPLKESIRIMSDNKAVIQISENPMQHDRTKHVEVDRHFIKDKLEAGIIKLPFVKYEDQLADILTKAVGMVILHKCLNKLNFGDPTIQLEGEC
ncbi:putative RNA-directed DNA polymerase [Tanacetum coccineum]